MFTSVSASAPVLVLAPAHFVAPLGVMRSLRGLGARTYCLAPGRASVAGASRWCAGRFAVGTDGRPRGLSDGDILDQLLDAGRRLGGRAILLSASDEWALFVAAHAEAIREQFTFPDNPSGVVRALTSKVGLHDLAVRERIATPRIQTPDHPGEVAAMAAALGYPLLLKPIVSLPGQEGVALVSDPAELIGELAAMGGPGRVLLQEYVPGDERDIWMYSGYFDRESRCLAAFTARKLRQNPPGMGVCSLGVCERNEEVEELSARFLSAIGYRGVVDVDYRCDARDGTYRVLDVNPRLGGAFRLMVDRDGLDVARAMYLDLTGRPVPPVRPNDGRKWVYEAADLLAYRRYRRWQGLTARGWLRSLRGAEPATFALADPGPFLVSMGRMVAETLSGRWRWTAGRVRSRLARPSGRRSLAVSDPACREQEA
jgi:predicted ATP-grasp superfamily ATP-dependent carboligase